MRICDASSAVSIAVTAKLCSLVATTAHCPNLLEVCRRVQYVCRSLPFYGPMDRVLEAQSSFTSLILQQSQATLQAIHPQVAAVEQGGVAPVLVVPMF